MEQLEKYYVEIGNLLVKIVIHYKFSKNGRCSKWEKMES